MLKPTIPIDDVHYHDDEKPAPTNDLLRATAEEIVGPFCPTSRLVTHNHDLTRIAGSEARALGQIVYLSGLVTDRRGAPVQNADIELWQANGAGRYAHPADNNTAPIDPNFQGHARIRTDHDGRWRIKTIKPGGYPVTQDWTRPPHIHFDIRGHVSRLVTQMYFEGEPLNEKDVLLQRSWGGKETAISHYIDPTGQVEPSALVAVWNIVLLGG